MITYMFKKKLFICVLSLLPLSMTAQENPLWMRFCAISPDGQQIAFSYKGDIYTVATTGGEARQLTTNSAYDAYPVWSPDGQQIAFASTREGGFDVWLMSRKGGIPTRLTTNSSDEFPITFSDKDHVLFSTKILATAKSIVSSRNFPLV